MNLRSLQRRTTPGTRSRTSRRARSRASSRSIAGVLGHIAFWDGRVLSLADKLDDGESFTESDSEPEDVDWINDASRPLIHAIEPRETVRLSLAIAEETDARCETLPLEALWPQDPNSPLYAVRADHLDDIERTLRDLGLR